MEIETNDHLIKMLYWKIKFLRASSKRKKMKAQRRMYYHSNKITPADFWEGLPEIFK